MIGGLWGRVERWSEGVGVVGGEEAGDDIGLMVMILGWRYGDDIVSRPLFVVYGGEWKMGSLDIGQMFDRSFAVSNVFGPTGRK